MKTVKDKYLVVGADFAGFPLKEVVEHPEKNGERSWTFTLKKIAILTTPTLCLTKWG